MVIGLLKNEAHLNEVKSNLQTQGPRMEAIDFDLDVLDRVW